MLTTPALIESLVSSEGFRSLAYDDKQPWLELAPGEEDQVKGKITYGHGLTTREDGTPVQLGDTITEGESLDRVARHVREEIEPTLENLIHHDLPSFQYDAIAHAMYQYGAEEVSGWRLIRRINAREDWEKIALEWINGTVMWMGEPLFWSRRIKEVLMFFGLDWRAADNVPADSDIIEVIEDMGFTGEMPVAGPVHTPARTEYSYDEDLLEEQDPIFDPTPETPLTTKDLNEMQEEHLRTGAPLSYERPIMPVGKKPLSINTKQAEEVPYGIDPKAGLQPKEEAERYRRAVKKEKGIEMKQIGQGLTLTTGVVAGANELSGETKTFLDTLGTIGLVLLATAFAIGIGYWLIGYAREKWNERKEIEAEINAVQGMY